jgi:membrane-associated protease RseP (regulator of RpoE activity)
MGSVLQSLPTESSLLRHNSSTQERWFILAEQAWEHKCTVNSTMAAQNQLPVDHDALVVGVPAHSPAEQAGLHVDDIIVQVDTTPVESAQQLQPTFRSLGNGFSAYWSNVPISAFYACFTHIDHDCKS